MAKNIEFNAPMGRAVISAMPGDTWNNLMTRASSALGQDFRKSQREGDQLFDCLENYKLVLLLYEAGTQDVIESGIEEGKELQLPGKLVAPAFFYISGSGYIAGKRAI